MVSLQAALAMLLLGGTGQTVLLDFYSDNCGPCRAMAPTVQALAAKGYPVRKVNIEQEPALKSQFGVTSIPCYVMIVDGREVDRVVGGTTLFRLERMFKQGSSQGPLDGLAGGPAAGGTTPDPQAGARQAGAPRPMRTPPPSPPDAERGAAPWGTTPPTRPDPTLWPTSTTLPERGAPAPAASARGEPIGAGDEAFIAPSVRLRIEDPRGHSCGSGTIIDARDGKALILTCGHIFRDSQGRGRIEVDLFGPTAADRVPGRLESYDLKADVGLVSIRVPGAVASARVAPPGYRVGQGEPVVSVGCNNGGRPTAVRSRVASIDKFVGPPNLQVAGQPIEGRSGGGLFSDDGLVIGVCNAADPSDHEGLFAALGAIHAALDSAGFDFVYKSGDPNAMVQRGPAQRGTGGAAEMPRMPKQMPSSERGNLAGEPSRDRDAAAPASGYPASGYPAAASGLAKDEQAALDEIRRRLNEGAEIVCLVRSRTNPQAKSEVIVLDRASPEFLRQLAAENQPAQGRHLTSLDVPRERESSGSPSSAGVAPIAPPRPLGTAPITPAAQVAPARPSQAATAWPTPPLFGRSAAGSR